MTTAPTDSAITETADAVGIGSSALFAILDQIESWAEWHCDPDADIDDPSPKDMHAHTNGLIMQACAKAREILANTVIHRNSVSGCGEAHEGE